MKYKEHDCSNKLKEVEIEQDFEYWHLILFEEDYHEFDDDGLVGFETDYTYLGEVKIQFCPFCGEKLE